MPATAAAPLSTALPHRLCRVSVHRHLAEVRPVWEALLAVAPASGYQTPAWVAAWLATRGRGVAPVFVLGYDGTLPVALLPLGCTRRGNVTTARLLGGRDSNWGLGLFHPGLAWSPADVARLIEDGARLAGIDLVWLANQPQHFDGFPNPLGSLRGSMSPSLQHEARLKPGVPIGSARSRKTIRGKEAKLAALGPVSHEVAADAVAAARIAAALVQQREARFGASSTDVDLRNFLVEASAWQEAGAAPVELHALRCGDAILATFAGAAHAGRMSGMLVSFADVEPWARFSPGELLIGRIMAEKALQGFAAFDLGVGEARYKTSVCPEAVPLFDTVLGMTPRGRLAAALVTAYLDGKRRLKRAPRVWAIAQRGLRWFARASGRFAARRG